MAIDFPSSPVNGETYSSGGTTWVYDSSVPAWNLVNNTISGPTGPTGPTGPVFDGYDGEIHVSAENGDDTNGDGDLVNPVATLTKAVSLVSGNRATIIVHPGSTYTESVTLTAKTIIKAAEGPAYSDGPFINGTITIPAAATNSQVAGLSISTVTISESAAAFLFNCNVTTLNKTSSGTVFVSGGSLGAGGGSVSITGTGVTRIVDILSAFSVTNNNASSTCTIVNAKILFNPVNTAGNMFVTNSTIFGTGTYGITSAAGSCQLINTTVFNSTGTATLPVSFSGGFYAINNCNLNYASSSFSGATDINTTHFFGRINANSFITRNGTSSQYVKGDGSLESLTPVVKTADFTVATTESYLINNKTGSACVVTLPAAGSFTGRKLVFTNYQAEAIDSDSSNVVPVGGGSAGTAIVGATAGAWATLISDGTNWLIVQEG